MRKVLVPGTEDRGETGIGNMILFIAMILVSALAAGLFIQTMADLQQQAQETGEQTMIDVSTGLKIVTATGDRDPDGDSNLSDDVQRIRLTVELIAGSKPIDMDNIVIQVMSEDTTVELTFGGTTAGDADAEGFGADEVRDPDGTWDATDHIVSSGALIEIWIDPSDFGMDIPTSTSLEVRLIPMHGSVCLMRSTTPSTYITRYIDLK